jgi:hypothetical protein
MKTHITTKIAAFAFVLLGALAQSQAGLTQINGSEELNQIKGLGGCPCVKRGQCASITTASCGTIFDYGNYCERIDAGPAQKDTCESKGTDPSAQCTNANGQNNDPDCFFISTGHCVFAPIPTGHTICDFSANNVPAGGKGLVLNGPKCPTN